jgi:hypothetical protein
MYLDYDFPPPPPQFITDMPKRRNIRRSGGKVFHTIGNVVALELMVLAWPVTFLNGEKSFPECMKFSTYIITSTILDCIGAMTEGFTWNL